MAQSQEEYENQPKESETITQDDVGSMEAEFGEDFFKEQE